MRSVSFAIAVIFSGVAHAANVAVVQPDGKPAARATALCVDPVSADPLIVTDGRVAAPGECRRLRCDATGFLPGEVGLGAEAPRCVLQPATVVGCELAATAAATGLEARLLSAAKGNAAVAKIAVPKAGEGRKTTKFALPPVKPGRYTLQLWRGSDGWSCRADLGPLGPGTARLIPAWREPVSLPIKVKLPDGKPAPGWLVRAWSPRPVPGADGAATATAFGTWTCSSEAPITSISDQDGLVRIGVDFDGDVLVMAGEFKNPRGLAYATLDRAPTEPLPLTLARPVIVIAKVEDERDQPVPCDVAFEELAPDVAWLAKAAGGSTVKSICDPQGGIALGPIPATPLTLGVLPRPGLPLRVTIDAPAAGTTADLGILRVRNGESFRVVVQDELGRPIPEANVTLRGSAGVVLSVAGVTGADGAVNLPGLPKNAIVAFDVKAKGFMPAKRSHLELDASPFIVKLSRGGTISGTVRDRDGGPIEGASVSLGENANEGREPARTDIRGAFALDGVDDGTWRLTAKAPGYSTSDPQLVEVREHRPIEDVTIELSAAEGISGRVVDSTGTAVAGAQVRLVHSQQRSDIDRLAPLAEATSGTDGAFQLRAAAAMDSWLVATKPGFGPCAVRAPDPALGGDLVLTLPQPAFLIVHVARGARTSRGIGVVDGAGVGRTVPAGAAELSFSDLAPGRGSVKLGRGPDKPVTLIARETSEITLDASSAVEGRVTFDGAPCPRTFVSAIREAEDGGLSGFEGNFTDERGRFRIDGLAGDSYRIVAVGEDGRAEAVVDLADGETAKVDLALRSIRLLVMVVDGANDKPVAAVGVSAAPAGKVCSSSMGSTSWGDPGELGFDLAVGSNGCVSSRTDAAGLSRLALAAPGSYDLSVGDDSYEPWKQAIALGEGTTTKRVALTRKPDKSGDRPHVVANLKTYPPGLSGRVECRYGGNTNSSSPVAGRFDCGEMQPGPGEVSFVVEGYGRGRVTFDVPATGELEVDVDVPRGGTLIVPVTADSTVRPLVVDDSGFAWSDATQASRIGGSFEDLPSGGRGWVFRDVPPGTYTVTVDGKRRPPVPVASGTTAYAN